MAFSDFNLKLKASLTNIHRFSRDILHFNPTKQQSQLFSLVQFETFAPLSETKKGIFGASGQGPGKTAASCVCALFRLFQVRNSMVLVTSPTARQVQDVWINELRRRVAAAPLEFQRKLDIQIKKVTVEGVESWAIKTATGNREENIQGYHDNNLTIIVDEASGIPRVIWRPLKGTLTQSNNLMIAIGNPNDRDTEFFDAFFKDSHLYHTFNWSSEDSPNVDKKHIAKMEAEYGRESDVFRVRVLGLFPNEAPNVIIRYEDLLHATRNKQFFEAFTQQAPRENKTVKQIGIDIARFGSDESVIVARYNSAMVGIKHFSKKEPADVIRSAFLWQKELGWDNRDTWYCADAGGMGQGVMHLFYESGKNVFEFNSGGGAFEPLIFKDAISEAYFHLRDMTRRKLIHLKEDQQMFSQLVTRLYYYREGLIQIEDKDEYMDRVGREEFTSPDRADATALAFYPYVTGSGLTLGSTERQR